MKRKIAALLLLGAMLSSALAGCASDGETSSAASSEAVSSSQSSSSTPESSSEASSEAQSEAASSSASSEVSSAPESATSSSSSASTSSKVDINSLYRETEDAFTFQNGVYRRIYGNRAVFVVTKDPSGIDDKTLSKQAEETAGDYYKNKYFCTVVFVKPDKDDGTFDMTTTKTDKRVATVYDMHRPDVKDITIDLSEHPLQEYVDKQFKKAKVKS